MNSETDRENPTVFQPLARHEDGTQSVVATRINEAGELQIKSRESLGTHFPKGSMFDGKRVTVEGGITVHPADMTEPAVVRVGKGWFPKRKRARR